MKSTSGWSEQPRPRSQLAETLTWCWSSRDEHSHVLHVLGGITAFAIALHWLPRRLDVIHTFEHGAGFMAPTCGLTRAGLALFRGDVAGAWTYNPAIFVFALATLAAIVRLLVGVTSRRWLTVHVHAGRWTYVVAGTLVGALWVNQQMHFALLAR